MTQISGSNNVTGSVQVLAELYHIQPPLLAEEGLPANVISTSAPADSQPADFSPQCGQPVGQLTQLYNAAAVQTPAVAVSSAPANSPAFAAAMPSAKTPAVDVGTPAADAQMSPADTAHQKAFISRRQLGIDDGQNLAFADSGHLEDALATVPSNDDPGSSQLRRAADAASASEQQVPGSQGPQTKPLCSQEWKIRHVRHSIGMLSATLVKMQCFLLSCCLVCNLKSGAHEC